MASRPIEINDLFQLRLVDELHADPTGERIVFTVTQLNLEDDEYRSRIWLKPGPTSPPFPLTGGLDRDNSPAWSPDGSTIAFLSDRGAEEGKKSKQLFTIPATGGEPEQLTDHRYGIETFDWSPDGRRLLFVASQPDQGAEDSTDSDVRVITSVRFRSDGAGFLEDRFKQVFVLDVASREVNQLTSGPFDHVQATWSPTGYEIACISNRQDGWEFSSVRDIYLIKDGSGHVRRLTDGGGRWSLPSWSPDGRTIAALGTRNLKSGSARNELFVISVADREIRSCTTDVDVDLRDASLSDWSGYATRPPNWIDSDKVLCVASIAGYVVPVSISTVNGAITHLADSDGRFGYPQQLADGGIVCVRSDFNDPGEVVQLDANGGFERLTEFNAGWRDSVALNQPEAIVAHAPDGVEISGWLLRPPGLQDGASAPLLLEIHGGPFGMYGDTFMHEFHLLAAQGYGVLFTNPRGSAGYGDEFAEMLLPEMGENDLSDLLAVLDKASDEPWVDRHRLGVLGGSYGGFMTNWVIAHDRRFKAAVTQRTVADWYSAWGTDDIFFADENVTLGATPWEDPEIFFRLSPLSYVDKIHTPLLIIHSEEDYRCPIPQGEQLFTALKRLGRTVEFVRVPEESHGLSRSGRPAHRVERLRHIMRWFAEFL